MPQYPPYQPSSDDEHPFLTPNGLRLQRQGRKLDSSVPMSFPVYPEHPQVGGESFPIRQIDPFNFDEDDDAPIDNVLPSAKFPQPEVLGLAPLTPYYKSRLVPDPQASELRAIGKLFIQVSPDPRQQLATGSAWISGPSTIVTSAHNLYDSNSRTWSKAIEFHPGYDYYATTEKPTCRVTSCYLPRGYFDNPTTNRDIAVCYVDRNIGDIVNAQIPMQPAANHDMFNHTPVAIVGYPAGSDFDFGKRMWQSIGDFLFGRSNGPDDDYSPAMATNFGAGSSGCPWLIKDTHTGHYVAVGATSGHAKLRYVRGEPSLMSLTSPFFGPRMFDQLNDNPVFHDFDMTTT